MSGQEKLILHSYRRCPFAMRVRMVLHEKGLDFETLEENLRNFSEELKKMHPEAKVPVLIHGDKVLYESAIITEYLDETFPTPALMPENSWLRFQVRLWTYWCNQHFKAHVDHYKYGESRSQSQDVLMAPERLTQDLSKLEQNLQHHPWLIGDEITLADFHVFPFVRQLKRATPYFEVLDQHPHTLAWLEKICARPSFEKTMKKKKAVS
ncbi:MAG: glutathione S-transferase family protein [Bdellovibrionales bacterium]|nr:glutathione S-transferase family protein [Bdellovibrionales bacterium]